MFIHNKSSETFTVRCFEYIREIVQLEMGLTFKRNRIHFSNYNIPLSIAIFQSSTKLGFFDQEIYQIGLNQDLMFLAKSDTIKDIIRHELAHMIVGEEKLKDLTAHGHFFKTICGRYNWRDSVIKAHSSVAIENSRIEGDLESERVISKVKKLLALTTSSNTNEAELATIKANELLIKHNLHKTKLRNYDEETAYLERAITGKRKAAKHIAISEILKHFFVSTIFHYGKGVFHLEVIGTKTNVELATYVANFLNNELDKLWKQTKKDNQFLKGLTAKNSFMRGISKGYDEKINTLLKSSEFNNLGKELSTIKNELDISLSKFYPRLSKSYSRYQNCQSSENFGKLAGRNLSINRAINSSQTKTLYLE